jgi:hypothetical protein
MQRKRDRAAARSTLATRHKGQLMMRAFVVLREMIEPRAVVPEIFSFDVIGEREF